MGGLGRPLREVLAGGDPRPQPGPLFGDVDLARVEATLAALRHALAAAFPADAVVSRYVLEGAGPVTCLTTPPGVPPGHALVLGHPTPAPDGPSLEARVDLGCLASVSVRRAAPGGGRPYDHGERRLFAAIVGLVRYRDSPL